MSIESNARRIESNARRIESNARVAESDDEILESVHACLHLLVEVSFLFIYCAAVGRTGTAGDPAAGLSLASRSCVSSLWRDSAVHSFTRDSTRAVRVGTSVGRVEQYHVCLAIKRTTTG